MEEYYKIETRQCIAWIVNRILGLVITSLFCIGLYLAKTEILSEFKSEGAIYSVVNTIIWVTILFVQTVVLINTFIIPIFLQKMWRWRIFEDRIECRSGVIKLKTEIVPEARIQQIVVLRTISDRIFRLSRIIVTTANSSIVIPGLDPQRAEEIVLEMNVRVNTLIKEEAENLYEG